MPSEQHEQWKRDLFEHLDRKLSGCIKCEVGEDKVNHFPTYDALGVRRSEPSQEILWTCERMHPHAFDLLRGGGSVVMERQQSAPVSGLCRPDLTVLNRHREPTAFIEIVRSHRPGKSLQVGEELGIPLFTILAPHRDSLKPGLHLDRPWWELDPTLSQQSKIQMHFMEQVGDELMRRNRSGDHTWAELDMMIDEDGTLGFASFRGSPPELSEPTFPRTGDLIVAEVCSWGCEEAMEVQTREWDLKHRTAGILTEQAYPERLGQIILEAIRNAKDGVGRLVVPIGTEEVHVDMSIRPLNPNVGPDDRVAIDLLRQITEASQVVRNRHRRDLPLDEG